MLPTLRAYLASHCLDRTFLSRSFLNCSFHIRALTIRSCLVVPSSSRLPHRAFLIAPSSSHLPPSIKEGRHFLFRQLYSHSRQSLPSSSLHSLMLPFALVLRSGSLNDVDRTRKARSLDGGKAQSHMEGAKVWQRQARSSVLGREDYWEGRRDSREAQERNCLERGAAHCIWKVRCEK